MRIAYLRVPEEIRRAGEIVNEFQAAALLADPHPRPDREAGASLESG